MLSMSVCQEVLARALAKGGTFAEIFFEDSRNFSMMLRSGRIENAATSRPRGAGIRVYDGLRSIYVYTCDVSRAGLLRTAERAAAAVTDTKGSGRDVVLHERVTPNAHRIERPVLSVPADERAQILRAADSAARAVSPSISQVNAGFLSREQHVLIANSEGLYTQDTRVYTRLTCSAVASSGAENQTGSENPGAMMGFELFRDRVDPEAVGRTAAKSAETMLTDLAGIGGGFKGNTTITCIITNCKLTLEIVSIDVVISISCVVKHTCILILCSIKTNEKLCKIKIGSSGVLNLCYLISKSFADNNVNTNKL